MCSYSFLQEDLRLVVVTILTLVGMTQGLPDLWLASYALERYLSFLRQAQQSSALLSAPHWAVHGLIQPLPLYTGCRGFWSLGLLPESNQSPCALSTISFLSSTHQIFCLPPLCWSQPSCSPSLHVRGAGRGAVVGRNWLTCRSHPETIQWMSCWFFWEHCLFCEFPVSLNL